MPFASGLTWYRVGLEARFYWGWTQFFRAFQGMVFFIEIVEAMLTDTKLRNLKPQDKLYKVIDRDGLYVAVTRAGSISFATTTPSTVGKRPSPSVVMA